MSDIRYIADKFYESNDEYISKKDAYLAVNAVVTGCESKETMEALATILVNIHHVPLADVAPIVHGHWIEELGNVISCRCSRCDHSYNLYEDDINGYPYCAWCGAKMGESEGKNNG